jgi:D-glycero-D-manno-heptose 1,7-bisphosphate phosphatase
VSRPAVFLDRDGTLIEDAHYIGKPEQVVLVAGAAEAVRRLNRADIPAIIVTNQSGIARGYFTEDDYERVWARVRELLAERGARVDATYMCPHHPDFSPPPPCECRKPGTLMFQEAAIQHDVDLARSWYIGDKLRDVLPARVLGGHGILVPTPDTPAREVEEAGRDFEVANSLDAAISRIVESKR